MFVKFYINIMVYFLNFQDGSQIQNGRHFVIYIGMPLIHFFNLPFYLTVFTSYVWENIHWDNFN